MNSIAIIGMSSIYCDNGCYFTKSAIRDYLVDLLQHYDSVLFFAFLVNENTGMESCLDHDGIRIVPIKPGISRFLSFLKLFFVNRKNDVILYMPVGMLFFPVYTLGLRFHRKACYLSADYLRFSSANPLKHHLYHFCHRTIISNSDVVIARGRYLAENAALLNQAVHETVPIGFRHEEISVRSDNDELKNLESGTLLYVGKIVRSKGIFVLLEAFKSILSRYPEMKLNIVGEGLDLGELINFVKANRLDKSVRFFGFVDQRAALSQIYSEADILVVPSIYPEGVPRVIDEAFRYYLPVIATGVGGISAEFKRGEISLIEPSDPEAIWSAVFRILEDPLFRVSLIDAGRERVSSWASYRNTADQHIRLLQSGLDEKNG